MFGPFSTPTDHTARKVPEERLPPLRFPPLKSVFGTASTNREVALVQLKAAIEEGRVHPGGEFWNGNNLKVAGKTGTAFGIILDGEAPKFFPDKFGLPMRLCFAGEAVFRGLPRERSLEFSLELMQGLVDHHSSARGMWENCAVFVLNELADSAASAQQAELIAMASEYAAATSAGKQPHNKLSEVKKFISTFKESGELVYVVGCLVASIADDSQVNALDAAQGLRYTAKLFEAQTTKRALDEKVELAQARQLGEQAAIDFFEQVASHLLSNFAKN